MTKRIADDFPAIARRLREITAERAPQPGGGEEAFTIAAGYGLDVWGSMFDCERGPDEADADYRARISGVVSGTLGVVDG